MDYQNLKCYANVLGDCSNKISFEHYVSKQVLESIDSQKRLMTIGLHSRSLSKPIQISSGSLGGKMLCEKHNNCLSGVDDVGGEYWRFISGQGTLSKNINGFEFEKWLLKIVCGLSYLSNKTRKNSLPLPRLWLEVLFNGATLPDGCGAFWLSAKSENHFRNSCFIEAYLRREPDLSTIWGGMINIAGCLILLNLDPKKFSSLNKSTKLYYHPSSIIVSDNGICQQLYTGWNGETMIRRKEHQI